MTNQTDKPVCVVVGVGPGNGASFARRFAGEGYSVALLARTTAFSAELAAGHDGMRAYACDVTDAEAVASAFATIGRELGPPDVLLFNAGSGTWGTFDEVPDDAFELAWRINALGLVRCTRAVVDGMLARGSGAIVVTGATASLRGKPGTSAFASAKAAQRSLAQSLARQLGPSGIHVALMIIDGPIAIPGRIDADADRDDYLDPDDVAAAALTLVQQPRSAWSFEIDLRPYRESW
jgi:NAD(P)-dependent dehydrogenase (short-subunit alcohol dehydrogenase family)